MNETLFEHVKGKRRRILKTKEIAKEEKEIVKDILASFKVNSEATIIYKQIHVINKTWLRRQGFKIYEKVDYIIDDERGVSVVKETIIDWSGN